MASAQRRLYYVTHAYPPFAGTRARYDWARALSGAGFLVTVLTSARPGCESEGWFEDPDLELVDRSIRVLRIPPAPIGWLGRALHRLRLLDCPQKGWELALSMELSARLRADPGPVLVQAPPLSSLTAIYRVARWHRVPFALDLRSALPGNAVRHAAALRAALLVSFASEGLRERTVAACSLEPRRAVVTPDGIVGPLPAMRARDFGGVLECVYAGPLDATHRPELFAEALALLHARRPEAAARLHFVFYGHPARHARRKLLPLLDGAGAEFAGFLSADALRRRLDEAHIGLLSLPEGSGEGDAAGSALFEYLAHGLPVLAAAPEGPVARILRNAGAGAVTRPGDAAAVASVLEEWLDRRAELSRLSANAGRAASALSLQDAVQHLGYLLRAALESA